jgi:CHASE3 domain sensor protein
MTSTDSPPGTDTPAPAPHDSSPQRRRRRGRRQLALGVGPRIACVTGSLLALIALAVGVAAVKTSAATAEIKEAEELSALAVEAGKFSDEMELQRGLQSEFAVLGDPEILVAFEKSAENAFGIADRLEARFPDNALIVESIQKARALDEKHDPLVFDRIAPAVKRGDTAEVKRLLPQAIDYVKQFKATGDAAAAQIRTLAVEKQDAASAAVASARRVSIIVGVAALIIGGLLSLLLARSITRPRPCRRG